MINLQKYLYGLFNGSLKPLIRKVKPLSFKRDGDNLTLRLVPSGTFFFKWKDPRETQQYFPTFVDGRGDKPPAILGEGLTPKDSRLEPVTSPRTEKVCTRLTN